MSAKAKDTTEYTPVDDERHSLEVELRSLRSKEVELRSAWTRSRERGHQELDGLIERAHAAVDRHVERIVREAASSIPTVPTGIADACTVAGVSSEELQRRLHAAIDEAPFGTDFGSFTHSTEAEARGELREVRARIAEVERQLEVEKAEGVLAAARAALDNLKKRKAS